MSIGGALSLDFIHVEGFVSRGSDQLCVCVCV